MKELTIEEKAKRYDEAIERAKLSRAQLLDIGEEATEKEHIFPELKESEDEKIRRFLINFNNGCYTKPSEEEIDSWLKWLKKQGEKFVPEDINEAALQYVDTCAADGEITHDNITEPYWNNHSMMNAYKAGWLEKQSMSQVRTGLEWVNTIDDACDKRYSEEYAHGEYCHEQSFKWGFQEGVDWREKQGERKFNVGDIISNGKIVYRVNGIIKNCIGQDCYSLVDVESVKKRLRYLTVRDQIGKTSHMGETTWLCEQVDKSFEKQGEKSDYNPYKETVKSISIMVEKYAQSGSDLKDFYDNVKVKCKDAMEYEKTWLEKKDEQKSTNKVKPKFKVGDKVNRNDREDEEYNILTITSVIIDEHCYTCHQGSVIDFEEQDLWHIVVEQNPTDKVEPKFKVGDWISKQYVSSPFVIVDIDIKNNLYILNDIEGNNYKEDIDFTHDRYHLWTIEDAEEGDVLAFDNDNIVIFKDLYNATTLHSYCHIEDGIFGISNWWEGEGFQPATEEQRDLLLQKMKEAGYEWDTENKELKKIEQKPAWSEEDESNLNEAIYYIRREPYREHDVEPIVDWLKSLKERIRRTD